MMKILLATDGMPHTDKTVDYAIEYAFRYRAMLFVLFVICPDRDQAATYAEGKEAVESIKMKSLSQEVSVTTMLEAGDPAETIIRISDRIEAELIIMGASGKCMESRQRPLGSVSSKVARDACCSVIIIR